MGGRFSVLKTRPFSGPKNEAELRARKQGCFLATLSGSQKVSKSSWGKVPAEPVFRNVVAAIGPHFWASCPGSHAVPGRTAASRNIHKAQGNRASFNVEALPSQLHHMCHRPSSTPQTNVSQQRSQFPSPENGLIFGSARTRFRATDPLRPCKTLTERAIIGICVCSKLEADQHRARTQ